MSTVRCTMAQALVRYLCNQFTIIDGKKEMLFPGVFAIFGHGNVTCLSEALEAVKDTLPTWRGQNEQSMALAAIGFAKAKRRRQIMVATSSIGPGALNMVTAAGVAHANRLPVLLLAGDTFANRLPDPVLQEVEHFGGPTITVNDAFKAVTRYWDRITHPAQIISSLPQATATMLDPADCGPAFLALPQDTQELAFDYPEIFFEPKVWAIPRPRPDKARLAEAGDALETVTELDAGLGDWRAEPGHMKHAQALFKEWNALLDRLQAPTNTEPPTYAQVVHAVNEAAGETDTLISAAGGIPGEVAKGWRVKAPNSFDLEFGFSCMGYEIPAGWGHAMANAGPGGLGGTPIVMVGDGTYMMMNSDIYSTVLSGHKIIVEIGRAS